MRLRSLQILAMPLNYSTNNKAVCRTATATPGLSNIGRKEGKVGNIGKVRNVGKVGNVGKLEKVGKVQKIGRVEKVGK